MERARFVRLLLALCLMGAHLLSEPAAAEVTTVSESDSQCSLYARYTWPGGTDAGDFIGVWWDVEVTIGTAFLLIKVTHNLGQLGCHKNDGLSPMHLTDWPLPASRRGPRRSRSSPATPARHRRSSCGRPSSEVARSGTRPSTCCSTSTRT